jgi:hypothetical protein
MVQKEKQGKEGSVASLLIQALPLYAFDASETAGETCISISDNRDFVTTNTLASSKPDELRSIPNRNSSGARVTN